MDGHIDYFKLEEMGIMEQILNSSYDGIGFTDEHGNVIYANAAYFKITGVQMSDIFGENIYDLAARNFPISKLALKVFETREPLSVSFCYSEYSKNNVILTNSPVFDKQHIFRGVLTNIRDAKLLGQLKTLQEANQTLRKRVSTLCLLVKDLKMIGESEATLKLVEVAHQIASIESSVLIAGESGVGKDVFAHAVHQFDDIKKPFIKISCSAIPENLLESELFGYEPGAFTGASRKGKRGIFELAQGGIVFLDEVGELPLFLQSKLLTVLQDRTFYRVGGVTELEMSARIIAATNRNLMDAVKCGEFREDLYYRLNVIPVYILPLRERKADIIPLANHFLQVLNEKHNTNKVFSPELVPIFMSYAWPGNSRELSNIVERMYVFSTGDVITPDILPDELQGYAFIPKIRYAQAGLPLKDIVANIEKAVIEHYMEQSLSLKEIANCLGITVTTLERKMISRQIKRRNKPRE